MKKTQTKTALMKIKVKQVSISSIKKKKKIPFSFSLLFIFLSVWNIFLLYFFVWLVLFGFFGGEENLTYSLECLSVCYFKQMQYFWLQPTECICSQVA